MSFSEWHRVSIKDVFELIPGFAFKSKDFSENGIPVIKIKNVKALRLLDRDFSYIDPKYLETKSRFTTKKGDLLISMTGNRIEGSMSSWVGKVCRINSDKKYLINQRVGILRLSNESYSDKFFLYLLGSEEIQKKLISIATSSGGQANISPDQIKSLEFSIPCFEEQNAIAHILSTLDDKIEVNNQINKTLENMAQAIFKQWFVDFEFPNEGGEPYKSSGGEMIESELGMIPKGWEVKGLDEIAEFLNGLAMQKFRPEENEKAYPVLKIKELRQGRTDESSDLCSSNIDEKYIVRDGDIIFSWSGSLLVDIWCGGNCGLNQHLFKVTSDKFDGWFVYQWNKYHLDRFVNIAKSKATTMGHIKRKDLSDSKVLIPSDEIYLKAAQHQKYLFEKIKHSKIEMKRLEEIRDALLPKLMSGKIRVPLDSEGDVS